METLKQFCVGFSLGCRALANLFWWASGIGFFAILFWKAFN